MKSKETDLTPAPRGVLIIGIGNPLRGDDALGHAIAEQIQGSPRPEGIDVIVTHQLTPELAEPISRAELVIFVDAAADLPAGRMKIVALIPATRAAQTLAHHCAPDLLLALSDRLYGHSPETWAISVGGGCFCVGRALSPELQQQIPALLHHIELLIASRVSRREAEHA